MNPRKESIIITTAFRYAIPLLFTYGIYVLVHGKLSPGGGFQAGGVLAMVVVLSRLVEGDKAHINISGNNAFIAAGLGTFLFALVGWLAVVFGGNFLEYSNWIPWGMSELDKHFWGILIIETGVMVCVMATIVMIYDAITGTTKGGAGSDDN